MTRSESVRSHDSTCLGAVLVKRRLEDAAAEDGGVAKAVRDRSRAHAVLASAAAPVAFLQPAGFPKLGGQHSGGTA